MALPKKITDLDSIPETARALYRELEDGYELDYEKAYEHESKRIKGFRDNNINLKKQHDKVMKDLERFEGLDPEKYSEAQKELERLRKLEEKSAKEGGDVTELVEQRTKQRVEAVKSEYEKRMEKMASTIEDYKKTNERYKSQLDTSLVESKIISSINNVAIPKKGALDDIRRRAKENWSVDATTGELVSRDIFDGDGNTITDPEEYAKMLLSSAPHLFEGAKGGGSSGGSSRKTNEEGVKWIKDTPEETGRYAKEIAEGKVKILGVDD